MFRNVARLPRAAWILYVGTFINKFGNFLSVFLVLYLTAKGYSAAVAGLALGIVGAGNFIGNMLGGTLADRIGRRPAIAVSMFGSGVCTLMVPLASNMAILLPLVGVIGIFAQLYRPASGAVLLDVVGDDSRTIAFAVYRLAINVGMAAGPLIGGILSQHSYTWIFFGDAASSIVYGLIALTLLPETKPHPATETAKPANRTGGYRTVFGDYRFVLFLLGITAATYIYIQSTATLPLQVRDSHLPNSFYGLLLTINAIVVVCVELPLTHLLQRWPALALTALGLIPLGVGFACTAFAHSASIFIITVLIWTAGEMIMMPSASAYPGRYAAPELRGRYQGAFGLAQTVATCVGPAIGGYLYSVNHTLNWTVCGIVAVVGVIVIAASVPQRTKIHKPEATRTSSV
jgi:MFS family permease